MKKSDVQLKIIDKILPYKMKFEKCECGNETFFVIFNGFRQAKPRFGPKGFDLSVNVDFYCSKCGEMVSGVGYNEELVDMKSPEMKMNLEDAMTPDEAKRLAKTLKGMPLPK